MYKNAAVFKFHATNINIVLSFFLRGIILDKNRIICYLTLIIAILLLLYGGLSTAATLILAVVAIAIILFTRRASLYFVKANRIYSAHDYPRYDEAFKYYKKTLKAGISPKYTVLTATILIQEGEMDEGKAALEKLLGQRFVKDETIRSQAKCALSLVPYSQGDYEKALELCQEVYEGSYRDNILYINMCTYLLALGRVKDFRRVVRDFSQKPVTSLAMLDLQAVYQLLEGDWKGARAMLVALFEKNGHFSFADPYLHMAQIMMHYGDGQAALDYIRRALADVKFRPVTVIPAAMLEELARLLEDGTKLVDVMASCDADPLPLLNGRLPEIGAHPGYVFADRGELESVDEEVQRRLEAEEKELEDKEPDTALNDDDEEWLRRHGNS